MAQTRSPCRHRRCAGTATAGACRWPGGTRTGPCRRPAQRKAQRLNNPGALDPARDFVEYIDHGAHRVLTQFHACNREQEHQLRIGRAAAVFDQVLGQQRFQFAAQAAKAADLAVVHEQVAAQLEGVAVLACDRPIGGRTHMREEQARLHLGAQSVQGLARPCGLGVAVDRGFGRCAVPAQPEAVTVRVCLRLGGVLRLPQQRVGRPAHQGFQRDRLAEVGNEAAHHGRALGRFAAMFDISACRWRT